VNQTNVVVRTALESWQTNIFLLPHFDLQLFLFASPSSKCADELLEANKHWCVSDFDVKIVNW
jgi:hypothetical protein